MTVRAEFIFCDDIRFETNGKALIVGGYTDGMVLSAFPAIVHVSIWIRIRGLAPGDHSISIRLSHDGNDLPTLELPAQINDRVTMVAASINGIPLSIAAPGKLTVELTSKDLGTFASESLLLLDQPSQVQADAT